ncbi:hypothetical protein ACHAW6_007560 [Cyclotella cf. meneghiniana]
MGVTIWDHDKYIKQVIEEHLNNKQVYQNNTGEIQSTIYDISQLLNHFLDRFGNSLPNNIHTFIHRSKQIHSDTLHCSEPLLKYTKIQYNFNLLWQNVALPWEQSYFQKSPGV